jgi:putative toxin-antitoxin system antitoxin component (TIGR02293 family)
MKPDALNVGMQDLRHLTNLTLDKVGIWHYIESQMDTQTTTKDVERFHALRSQPATPRGYIVLLGLDYFDLPSILKAIEKGFSWKTFERFLKNIDLPAEQVADVIGIPRRTLARRKVEGRLKADESDRLLRLARVFGSALDLFEGNREAAVLWLTDINIALGGVAPLEYARRQLGADEVEKLAGRIQYGIFS